MNWLGAGLGALLGSKMGGVLATVIGAAIGNWIEAQIRNAVKEQSQDADGSRRPYSTRDDGDYRSHAGRASNVGSSADDGQELKVLGAIAAMLSKMAKADGRITADEVRYCEGVFDNLGLRGDKRTYCIHVFQAAKNDDHTIYEYASSFASMRSDRSVREIVYGILWDVAGADGRYTTEEMYILRHLPSYLKINISNYEWECSRRGVNSAGSSRRRADDHSSRGAARHAEMDPYKVLGVSRSATDEEIKKAYRSKAKALHPDALRAQGLSEELMGKANEQMARVNAAWTEIRKERGIR